MSEQPNEREIDRSKMEVTDEIAIHISDMNKWFGNFHVLRDINLEVKRGERLSFSMWRVALKKNRKTEKVYANFLRMLYQ